MSIIFNMSAVAVPLPPVPETTLAELPLQAPARVLAVLEPGHLGERLLELGLTPGVQVSVVRRGLFGDPLQLCVRGGMLSVRRAQAAAIRVTPIE